MRGEKDMCQVIQVVMLFMSNVVQLNANLNDSAAHFTFPEQVSCFEKKLSLHLFHSCRHAAQF